MKEYTIIKPQTHEEWLQHRGGGIGSSEVGTILGLNPYETPYQLWRRKKGLDLAKENTFAMKAGHFLEDGVARFFEDSTGYSVDHSTSGDWIAYDNEKPFMRVSPDRLYRNGSGELCIVECKTTQKQIDPNDIPLYWFAQLQYQMGVMRIGEGAIAWLIGGREFGYKEIKFNQEFYSYMVDKVAEFWVENIQGGEEPLCINSLDIITKFPQSKENAVLADISLATTFPLLRELKERKKQLEEEIGDLEERIKFFMGENDSMIDAFGNTIVTWKTPKASLKFDEKKFKEENPELWSSYAKEVQGSRRFILK